MFCFKISFFLFQFIFLMMNSLLISPKLLAADCNNNQNAENRKYIYSNITRINLWKTKNGDAILYYKFELDDELKPKIKCTEKIKAAMLDITKKTGINFEITKNDNYDYVLITADAKKGNFSNIGKVGGEQVLNLEPDSCTSFEVIKHELLHALGMMHTHERWDRDEFVKIIFENIMDGEEDSFEVITNFKSVYDKYFCKFYDESECDKKWNKFPLLYDYQSIMHYNNDTFSKNELPTIVSKNEKVRRVGGKVLSPSDIAFLVELYQTNKESDDNDDNNVLNNNSSTFSIYKSVVGKNSDGISKNFDCSISSPCQIEIDCAKRNHWAVPIRLNNDQRSGHFMVGAQTLKNANISPASFCGF